MSQHHKASKYYPAAHYVAAFTIATTPARIAAGSIGHAAMIAASSASSGVETLAQTLGAVSPVS